MGLDDVGGEVPEQPAEPGHAGHAHPHPRHPGRIGAEHGGRGPEGHGQPVGGPQDRHLLLDPGVLQCPDQVGGEDLGPPALAGGHDVQHSHR